MEFYSIVMHSNALMINNLALGDGECILPPGHVVNPLRLQDSISFDDTDGILHAYPTQLPILYNHTNHIRVTRDTEKVVNTRTIIDKDGHRHRIVAMVKIIFLSIQYDINENDNFIG